MPAPKFHSPSPEISNPEEHEMQWWHIPVSVNRRLPRRDLPRCRAFVRFIDGQYQGRELPLRWRSDLPKGSSETALIFGQPSMLPLVAGRDKSPGALITDQDWFSSNQGEGVLAGMSGAHMILGTTFPHNEKEVHCLNPGKHLIKIKVRSGHLDWESSSYEIRVPEKGKSNSHFSVVEADWYGP